MDSSTRKRLRAIAHDLDPVVIVGDAGLSPGVVAETERAIRDHELIKAKVNLEDRGNRKALGDDLAARTGAEVVQRIGKMLVLFKANPEANPRLSNVLKFGR
ncbi:MAG: YhbY family RNA-binding protein [Pseudomonadota bacterium]